MATAEQGRRTLAIWLLFGGLVSAALAFWQAKEAQGADLVAALGGGRSGDRTLMWILVGATAIFLLMALMTYLSANRQVGTGYAVADALVPGWYDDPDDPGRLRYWDGRVWTDKTADKG